MFQFLMGDRVRHLHSSFLGTVTGRVEYISGLRSYMVTPPDGKDVDWFCEADLMSFPD